MRTRLAIFRLVALLLALPGLGAAQAPASTSTAEVAQLQRTIQSLTTRAENAETMARSHATRAENAESSVRTFNEKQTATYWTAAAAIAAASVAAGFAVFNQRAQAKLQRQLTAEQAVQGRLLTAIELVMQSRNAYEAGIRLENLGPFIPEEVKTHLERMLRPQGIDAPQFSGPEWTDLRVRMAETMAAKAGSPSEVLQIWRHLLPSKHSVSTVTWPPAA